MRALALVIASLTLAGCGGEAARPAAPAPPPRAAAVVDGPSARLLQRLPAGLASPDARRFFWLGGARLHVADTATGADLASLPVGGDARLAGLSPNGVYLVLSEAGAQGVRFSAYNTQRLNQKPQVVDLPPGYEFDAIGNGGQNLYLIERKEAAGPGRYSVTFYSFDQRGLCNCTVIDKTEPGTALMRGTRVMSVPAPNGQLLYTLYEGGGHNGAFVHALSLESAFAWCIDLPPAPGNTGGWQIGLSSTGADLLAVNLAAGVAVRADIRAAGRNGDKPSIVAEVHFPPSPGPAPGRHGLIAAPDGHNLLVLGADSVLELDADSLQPRHPLLAGLAPVAISGSPDGQWQYALTAAGRVARLNPLQPAPELMETGLEAPLLVVR